MTDVNPLNPLSDAGATTGDVNQEIVEPRRFRIAFSFAGEKRQFVSEVAEILARHFGKDQILYDKFHEAEFARHDLGIYLATLYSEQVDLIVPVLCADYNRKLWTGWEWIHIYALLTNEDGNRVMPSRFDKAMADGLTVVAGFIELDCKTPEQFASLILERLEQNQNLSLDKRSRLTITAKPKSTFTNVAFRHIGAVFALMSVVSILALTVAWQFGFLNVREIASRKDAPLVTMKTTLEEFSSDRSSEQNETPLPPPPESIPGPYKAGLLLINDDDRTKKDFLETTITVVNETNSDIHLSFDYIPRESYEQESTYAHRVTDTIPARTTTGLRELNFGGPYHLSVLAFGTWYPENVWVDLKITANRTVVVTESGGRFQCAVIFDRPIK